MTNIDINKLREYKEQGYTIKEIAKKFNTERTTIVYLSRIHKIKHTFTKKGRRRCIMCGKLANRNVMQSNNKGLFCPECWEKRREVYTYATD